MAAGAGSTIASLAGTGACFRDAMLDGLPVPLLPFARGSITLLLLLPWLLRSGFLDLKTRRPGLHLFRCTAGLTGFFLHMLAILWMPLADAVAVMQARPLWALPLAFLLLGEHVGRDRALAAALGFVGVLVIVGPGGLVDSELGMGTAAAVARPLPLRP